MAPALPGYYFDPSKNRYFKIQSNHVAPAGVNYSRQAVAASDAIRRAELSEHAAQRSKAVATVSRSALLRSPLVDLDRRLGNLKRRPGTVVAEYYATCLSRAPAVDFRSRPLQYACRPYTVGGAFAVEKATGTLYAAIDTDLDGRSSTSIAVITRSEGDEEDHSDLSPRETWPTFAHQDAEGLLYESRRTRLLEVPCDFDYILPVQRHVVCAKSSSTLTEQSRTMSSLYIRLKPTHSYSVSVHMALRGHILDLAAPPSESKIAVAMDEGVSLLTELSSQQLISSTSIRGEQMRVSFKDENVIMSGARSGKMIVCDIRSSQATSAALRIQHSSAISGLAALADGSRVLVNGLTDMKIYDLRFAPRPTLAAGPVHRPGVRAGNRRQPRTYDATTPVLTFQVPETRRQNQYGLAFAYDPELNIVLSASTNHHHHHRVGIWSASTGQLLKSPLNEYRSTSPVACAQIVRVRDGPKSILLAADGGLWEWSPQENRAMDNLDPD